MWYFRGWAPASTQRDEFPRPDDGEYVPAHVEVDGRAIPVRWTVEGAVWALARVEVHWVIEHAGAHGTDLGIWQVRGTAEGHHGLWDLTQDPGGHGWRAAPHSDDQCM